MRLNTYLNEVVANNQLDEESTLNVLSSSCSSNRKHCKIFRGDSKFKYKTKASPFFLFPKDRGERKSAHTYNHYTLLIDNLPCWKDYPKRSKSLICSSDVDRAQSAVKSTSIDQVLTLIPFDGSVVGICPKYDIWDGWKNVAAWGFELSSAQMYGFNSFLHTYMFIKDSELLRSLSMSFESIITKHSWRFGQLQDKYEAVKNDYNSLGDWLSEVLDPRKNGFSFTTSLSSIPAKREVWFDGSAIGYFYSATKKNDKLYKKIHT